MLGPIKHCVSATGKIGGGGVGEAYIYIYIYIYIYSCSLIIIIVIHTLYMCLKMERWQR